MDNDWGHVIVKISGHPPFAVQIILNGHEWVEREALRKKVKITKEQNCFTSSSSADIRKLCQIADTLYAYMKKGSCKESVIAGCTVAYGLV